MRRISEAATVSIPSLRNVIGDYGSCFGFNTSLFNLTHIFSMFSANQSLILMFAQLISLVTKTALCRGELVFNLEHTVVLMTVLKSF